MEIELTASTKYDETHPNYERWKRARDISLERGKFVKSVVLQFIDCNNLKILDIASGEGSTAKIFADKNCVISLERNPIRLRSQLNNGADLLITGDAVNLPFKEKNFDLIILQDCIEHIRFNKNIADQLCRLLNDDGIIYLSTPNKHSILNLIADPHWGLPFLSFFKRKNIKKYFLKYFRKKDLNRDDIAELYSLPQLRKLFSNKFLINLNSKYALKELLNGNRGLVWSSFHIKILKLVNILRFGSLLLKTANDKNGITNQFVTPTFYLILKKR